MEMWISKEKCMGCNGCGNVCPKSAIEMKTDRTGFSYPIINQDKCINCGKCKKACPVFEPPSWNRSVHPEVYAGWSKDSRIRYASTSGGAFSEIAKQVLEKGGYVAGAAYGKNNMVEHIMIHDMEGLEKIRQSKYIQSDTKDIYRQIKELLGKNEYVAFCGAPCQVAALQKFLEHDYEKLLTIEFICRGMNSPKAYRAWLDEIEKREAQEVDRVWFKYKENGWKSSPRCTRVDFKKGSYKVYTGKDNLFMEGYLGPNLYIRPSCGKCEFKGLPRCGDITLADFWGIEEKYDDDKGTSMILVNSEKGKEWMNGTLERLQYSRHELSEIYAGNQCFEKPVQINRRSEEFLISLDQYPFSRQVKKYSHISFWKRAVRKCKHILKK